MHDSPRAAVPDHGLIDAETWLEMSLDSEGTDFQISIQFVNNIKEQFRDRPEVYRNWFHLMKDYTESKKPIYDSELVARTSLLLAGAEKLVATFNTFISIGKARCFYRSKMSAQGLVTPPHGEEHETAVWLRREKAGRAGQPKRKLESVLGDPGHQGSIVVLADGPNKRQRVDPL
jgi:histone deacetylase complex regulatory component SIN3